MPWAVSPLGVMGWGWEMGPRRPFCWLTAPEPWGKKGRRETEQAKTDPRGTWDRKKWQGSEIHSSGISRNCAQALDKEVVWLRGLICGS